MANNFRVSIGVDIDAARAKQGAGEARQAVVSIGEAAGQATPKVQAVDAALSELNAAKASTAANNIRDLRQEAAQARTEMQRLIATSVGLHDGAANSNARAWTGLLASEGLALDNLRAKYNPLFAVISQYKAAQTEIRTAHAMGALSADEMTAALARQRQATMASIDAIKGRNSALLQQPKISPIASGASGAGGVFQTANIAAQFQDIGVTAAMGMNPLMIGLQQGAQMSAVLSTMEKPILGIGAALVSVLSPLSLATIGLTAAGAAAIQFFASWNSGADSLEADLKKQADLVSEIAKQFKGAGDAAQGYAQDTANVLAAQGKLNVKSLRGDLLKQAEDIRNELFMFNNPNSWAPDSEKGLKAVFDEFASSIERNEPQVRKFRDGLTDLKNSGIEDIGQITDYWLSLTDAMAETQAALDRIRNTSWMADQGMRGIADRWSGRENNPFSYGGNLGGVGMPAPSVLPQSDPRKSLDFGADDLRSATEALKQAQRAAAASGKTGLEATIASIEDRYSALIEKVYGAKDAIDLYRQSEALEIETARRRAAMQPLTDAARSASELERAVALQRSTFGMSAGDAANLTEQMRLYNEYARAGVEITPQLAWQIAEAGARYGAAAGDMDKLTRAQQEVIGRMDGLRGATNSALDALMDGNWDSIGQTLKDWSKNIITDQLTEGLLGRQGEAGGGLFGNMMSGLLGGAGGDRGASSGNPVWVTMAGASGSIDAILSRNTNDNRLGLIGGTDMLSRYREAIASVESSGNYSALGPLTARGDRAYGRYGVMGSNVGPWTQQALGYSMSPTQFLGSPAAQDAVFNKMFGGLLSRFGNANDAASAWFTGRPLALGANATDILGTTGSAYVDKFNAALGTATNGLQSFATSAKGAGAGPLSIGSSGYPAPLSLTPQQAAKMPAGVSAYGAGWAEQQLAGMDSIFSTLTIGLGGIVDQFLPGLGGVLGQLLNGIAGAGNGAGGSGGGIFSWLLSGVGGLFGGSGWGANNSAAFSLYANGGVPAARGLHSYANQIVSTPTVFAFANGAGVMGEAGQAEGIFPLKRNAAGQLGVAASWPSAAGNGDGGSTIIINNLTGSKVEHETTRDARGRRQEKFVISDAVGDAITTPGGGADRAMRQRYGMRTGGIRR